MEKLEYLMAVFQQQRHVTELLLRSDYLKNVGRLREADETYTELIALLERQIALSDEHNASFQDTPLDVASDAGSLVNAMLTRADLLETLGEREQASTVRDRAQELASEYLGPAGVAERQRQLAGTLQAQSRYHEAVVVLMAARDEFRARGDTIKLARVAADLAELLEWLGDDPRALAEGENARRFVETRLFGRDPLQAAVAGLLARSALPQADEHAELLAIWSKILQLEARVSRRLGNYSHATALFRRLIPETAAFVRPAVEFQIAVTAIEAGHAREGYDDLQRLAPAFVGLLAPKRGVLLSWQGEALLRLDEPSAALVTLTAACAELVRHHDLDGLWKTWWRRARALVHLEKTSDAVIAFNTAGEIITRLRRAPLGHRLDSTYLKDKLPLFQAAVDLSSKMDDARTAVRMIEQVKSRSLTAILSVPRGEERPAQELESEFERLSVQLDVLEYTGHREGISRELSETRGRLLEQRAQIIERIRVSEPRWRAMSEPVGFDLDGLLAQLAVREHAALTLFWQTARVVAVLLRGGRCRVRSLSIDAATAQAVEAYCQNLQAVPSDNARFDPASFPELDAARLIPVELLEEAIEARALVVCPHGPLHLIPWSATLLKKKRLFEYCPVGILPNLGCLALLGTAETSRPRVAVIGAPEYGPLVRLEPLFLSGDEVATIDSIYQADGAVFADPVTGPAATQEAFRKLASHPDAGGAILHVVCHGDFVTGEPLNSGLLLTDGKIDAAEISRCRMKYEEVVLSACASGYRPTAIEGVQLTGDDVVGLPGAILEAGARAVLVSITKARDDAALRFMTLYHEERRRGASPLLALQQTQKELLASGEYPPYLWVGFTAYAGG